MTETAAALHGVAVGRTARARARAATGRRSGGASSASSIRRAARRSRAGADGEICVRGPELLVGYYGRAPRTCFDATASSTPAISDGSTSDGALHFVGRLKDVIKTAGANVAAAEVEAVLLEHPAVAAAHVGRRAGRGARRERRGVRRAEGARRRPTTLLAHCRDAAGELQGAATALGARATTTLPTKGSGKVDKAALRTEAARPHSRRRPPAQIVVERAAVSGT